MKTQVLLRASSRLVLVALLGSSGCGEPSERPSEVNTLRVLAVRAETPFARPGTDVGLEMLSWDGSPSALGTDGTQRSVSRLWLGGCTNPPGDSYLACLPFLGRVLAELGDQNLALGQVPPEAPAGWVGWGSTFTAKVLPDTVSSRAVAPGVVHPYGVQMVFFAACAGELRRLTVNPPAFPLGCFAPDTGAELGRDDFDFGFYPLYVYDEVENSNPELSAVRFQGLESGPSCSPEAPCPEGSHCGSSGSCLPIVPRCTATDRDDCPSHLLSIEVAKSSAELAITAQVPPEEASTESLWATYHASAGSWEQDARMVNDPGSGWGDKLDGKWRANVPESSEVRLWVVVRDNRNGVTWQSREVWVE
jgi:hypothetical protein